MKKVISLILALVIIVSVLALFSGCTSDTPKALAVIIGNNRNAPIISMNSGTSFYEHMYDTLYTLGTVSVVVADGNPFIYTNYSANLTTNVDAQKKRQLAAQWASQISTECKGAIPKTEEVDLLEALFVAVEALSNASDKELLICSSGLSTAGAINFAKQPYLKDMTPSTIVERLKDAHAIPDLTNTTVVWSGFGKTSGLQDRISKENEYKLKQIWTAILYAGGATNVTFEAGEFADDNTSSMPYVTPVVFDDKDIFPEESFVRLDAISFVSDTAQFIDREAAIEALSPFAAYLNSNPEKIILAGMTATVQHSDGVELSLERADACKKILIEEFGIAESLIITIGLGSRQNPLRKQDTDANGTLIESIAQENRAVYVCIYDSDIGRELSEIT